MRALVAATPALVAQSTTTSAITGTIRDQAGKPVLGAVVRVTSDALIGGSRSGVTSENGRYRIPLLPPGRYAITVEAKGFPVRRASEVAELGKTTTVDFKLAPEASAVVEVVEQSGAEEMATTTTRNFKAEEIANLPIKRDISAIAALTPGINLNVSSGARVSASGFGGDRDNANAYLINGINVGDSSSGQAWVQVNPDWFDEVQIGGIGAGAEFGGFPAPISTVSSKRAETSSAGLWLATTRRTVGAPCATSWIRPWQMWGTPARSAIRPAIWP
jgi:hypothetical protein